jgi:hypothetical protein
MRPIFLAICLIALSTEAALAHQSAGEQWEQALLSAKRHGTLAGPRPGQVCLWAKPLGACLWYTPSKWNLMLTEH